MYNYSKLRGRIVEKFGSIQRFTEAMDLSDKTVSSALNNKREWKQKEISKAVELLEIELDQIHLYFFTMNVQSN